MQEHHQRISENVDDSDLLTSLVGGLEYCVLLCVRAVVFFRERGEKKSMIEVK